MDEVDGEDCERLRGTMHDRQNLIIHPERQGRTAAFVGVTWRTPVCCRVYMTAVTDSSIHR